MYLKKIFTLLFYPLRRMFQTKKVDSFESYMHSLTDRSDRYTG